MKKVHLLIFKDLLIPAPGAGGKLKKGKSRIADVITTLLICRSKSASKNGI